MAELVATVKPDDRMRFNLAKFIARVEKYRVYVEDGGRRVILEAVVD